MSCKSISSILVADFLCKFFVDSSNEVKSVKVTVFGNIIGIMDANSQIFCHLSSLYALNCCSFKTVTEFLKFWKIVQLSSV